MMKHRLPALLALLMALTLSVGLAEEAIISAPVDLDVGEAPETELWAEEIADEAADVNDETAVSAASNLDELPVIYADGQVYGGAFPEGSTSYSFSYTLVLPESGTLKVTMGDDSDMAYELRPENSSMRFFLAGADKAPIVCEVDAGRYVFEVMTSKLNSSYSFSMTFTPSGESCYAPNDNLEEASKLAAVPLKKTVTGFFTKNDNRDWYKFKLAKAGTFTVKVPEKFTSGKITVYDVDGNILGLDSYGSAKASSMSLSVDLAPCTCYAAIEAGNYIGIYHVTGTLTPCGETCAYENNSIDSIRKKTAIGLGKKVVGQLAINDDKDFYKITIPKDGDYSITVRAEKQFYLHEFPAPWVYRNNETDFDIVRHEFYYEIGKLHRSYFYRDLPKGTYYLRFEADYATPIYGLYDFTVTPAFTPMTVAVPLKKGFRAVWSEKKVDGYQVQYALNKKFTKSVKTVTVTDPRAGAKEILKLPARKTYYTRVRSYVKIKKKYYYSDWSNVMKVKTKK